VMNIARLVGAVGGAFEMTVGDEGLGKIIE
jgi:hypothetical protein